MKLIGISQRIEVSPVVNFNKLEEVIVLTPKDIKKRKKEWKLLDKLDRM